MQDFITDISQAVNNSACFLADRKWDFCQVDIRKIYPKQNRKVFAAAFATVAKLVAQNGFYLADEPVDLNSFSNVRLYYRRPLKMVPKKCTCPNDLKGERSRLYSLGLQTKLTKKAKPEPEQPTPTPTPVETPVESNERCVTYPNCWCCD